MESLCQCFTATLGQTETWGTLRSGGGSTAGRYLSCLRCKSWRTDMKQLMVTALLLIGLTGCAVIEQFLTDKGEEYVKEATADIIADNPLVAGDIIKDVQTYRHFVQEGEEVTMDQVRQAAIETASRSGLDASRLIRLLAVLELVELRVEQDGKDGVLSEGQRVELLNVLDWVEAVAREEVAE